MGHPVEMLPVLAAALYFLAVEAVLYQENISCNGIGQPTV